MQIYQTNYQKEIAELYPTKLDFETITHQRGLIKTQEENFNFYRTIMGNEGEATVIGYLQTYGKKHWIVLKNF